MKMLNTCLLIAFGLWGAVGCDKESGSNQNQGDEIVSVIDIIPLLNSIPLPKGVKMKSKKNAFSENIVAFKYWIASGGGGILYPGGALFDIKEMPSSDKTYRTKLEIFSEYVMNNIINLEPSFIPIYNAKNDFDNRFNSTSYVLHHPTGFVFLTFSKFDWEINKKEYIKLDIFACGRHVCGYSVGI